jgi:hypothetical protein
MREATKATSEEWEASRAASSPASPEPQKPSTEPIQKEAEKSSGQDGVEKSAQEKPPEEPQQPKLDLQTKVEWERDGQKVSASIEELQLAYDWSLGAFGKQQEAEKYIRQAEQVFSAFDQGVLPAALEILAARKFGGDRNAAYQELLRQSGTFLKEWHDLQQLPEPERRLKEMETALRERELRLNALEAEKNETKRAEEELKIAERIRGEILGAMKAESLEATASSVRQVGEVLLRTRENGFNPSVGQVVRWVKQELAQQSLEGLKTLPAEEILRLRPELREIAAKAAIDAVAANRSARVMGPTNGTARPGATEGPRVYRDSPFEAQTR